MASKQKVVSKRQNRITTHLLRPTRVIPYSVLNLSFEPAVNIANLYKIDSR